MPQQGRILERRARETGNVVSLYYRTFESDPEIPWETVCHTHGTIVCHETRRLAESWMVEPTMWCQGCLVFVQELDKRTAGKETS